MRAEVRRVAGAHGVHRAEGPEEHVAEGAVHGPAHDDRQDDPRRPVQGSGHDQELVLEDDAQGRGREAGVAVQQRDDRRHVGAADRDDQEHAEGQRQDGDDRHDPGLGRIGHQHDHQGERHTQDGEVHRVLALVDDGPLRQPLLQLARGHQAPREDEEAEPDLDAQHGGRELVDLVPHQVVVGRPDQRRRQAAEGVRERDPLRHGGHRDHQAQRDADRGADQRGHRDQHVALGRHVGPEQRRDDRDAEPDLAGEHPPPRGLRRGHPLEREGEPQRRHQVRQVDPVHPAHEGAPSSEGGAGRGRSRARNIFSMRSVMRKPPTTLMVEATTAMKPSTFA